MLLGRDIRLLVPLITQTHKYSSFCASISARAFIKFMNTQIEKLHSEQYTRTVQYVTLQEFLQYIYTIVG